MVRSLSVDATMQRRSNSYFRVSAAMREVQGNDTRRLRWRRLFLNAGRRLFASNIEQKLREASNVYRERVAFKKVIPNLKQRSAELFSTHLAYDKKDTMKMYCYSVMSSIARGHIAEVSTINKAMEIIPKRK